MHYVITHHEDSAADISFAPHRILEQAINFDLECSWQQAHERMTYQHYHLAIMSLVYTLYAKGKQKRPETVS